MARQPQPAALTTGKDVPAGAFQYPESMAPNAMQQIGSYTITRELGRGGMGVVYLARDVRLDRDVAIKTLPQHLANDPDRLARFQREAKVLASLNHPSIGAIYGIEEANGQQYLVLEYIEGETLAQRLERGAMPVDEAIDVAIKIAEALEAAHEKGVIHRDLKPGNIMVTPDGAVKVLDFGLARATEAASSMVATDDSPTLTSPMRVHSPTIPGAIMGTAGYMSPEQARGKPVDKRSDIFSFGCVLYEMLTGVQPFHGETVADSLGATLHKEHDQTSLPPNTPANISRLLQRCLAKDKRDRLHDIADARIELQTCGWEDRSTSAVVQRRATPGIWYMLAGLALAVATGAGVWTFKPLPSDVELASQPLPVLDAHITLPLGERLGHGFYPGLAISQDGRMLAFGVLKEPEQNALANYWATSRGIMIRRLDQSRLVQVPGTDDRSLQPVFSPDGKWIAYVSGRQDVYKTLVAGGQPIRLATTPSIVAGLAWTQDDVIIIGQLFERGLMQVPAAGGAMTPMTQGHADGGNHAHGLPHALPGGGVLYTAYFGIVGGRSTSVWALNRATGERTLLADNAAHAQYAERHIVFIREGNLMAAPFDPVALRVTGDARQLSESAVQAKYFGNISLMTSAGQFALSPSGTLALGEGTVAAEMAHTPVWCDREGNETPIEVPLKSYFIARTFADGTQTLFCTGYMPTVALWLHDNERQTTRRIINPPTFWAAPGPGPNQITCYRLGENHKPQLGILPIGGSPSDMAPIDTPDDTEMIVAEWSRDGRRMVAVGRPNNSPAATAIQWSWSRLWLYEREIGWKMISRESEYADRWPAFSPDGRWLAFSSNESGNWEVYIRSVDDAGSARQVSNGGGTESRWSHDGAILYYRGEAVPGRDYASLYSVSVSVVEGGEQLRIGRPTIVMDHAPYIVLAPVTSWDVAPDGRFLFIKPQTSELNQTYMRNLFPDRIRVVQNWAARLQQ